MADLVFIVSRTEPKQYLYLKHVFADASRDVALDRRTRERRRSLRPPPVERMTARLSLPSGLGSGQVGDGGGGAITLYQTMTLRLDAEDWSEIRFHDECFQIWDG